MMKDTTRARLVIFWVTLLQLFVAGIVSSLVFVGRERIARLYTHDPQVVSVVVSFCDGSIRYSHSSIVLLQLDCLPLMLLVYVIEAVVNAERNALVCLDCASYVDNQPLVYRLV